MQKSLFYITSLIIIAMVFTDCNGCSRHRKKSDSTSRSSLSEQTPTRSNRTRESKSVIKMRSNNGVYYVPCKINGIEMLFIFDTGASDITMSAAEAIVLYKQGKLSDDDFIGTQQYQIADGSIHEGMVVKLKSVEIGNRKLYDVRASIVDNMEAPLLLGQSALSKFGKISIDYKRNEISFE
ncbi:MAG: retroviral-like aspartic protease family protein [Prevotellaceae bacterium]|jgi:aspartyl protease family protein|nr:retroviral-like aspartic protease family protein [Prevotellaceae bacterium]